jgi:serine/threonine protein kinase
MSLINKTISNCYIVREKISNETFCSIWRARAIFVANDFMLRFLNFNNIDVKPENLDKFKSELRKLYPVKNRFIFDYIEVDDFEGSTFIANQFVSGQNLYNFMKSNKTPDTNAVIKIIIQIAHALEIIHEKKIIHKFINPESIWITDSANSENNVMLTNFAFYEIFPYVKSDNDISAFINYGFMSPEAKKLIEQPLEKSSDLYSLGVIYYYLLTGSIPYNDLKCQSLKNTVINEGFLLKSLNEFKLPQQEIKIITRLLKEKPSERYHDIIELFIDLKKVFSEKKADKKIEKEISSSDLEEIYELEEIIDEKIGYENNTQKKILYPEYESGSYLSAFSKNYFDNYTYDFKNTYNKPSVKKKTVNGSYDYKSENVTIGQTSSYFEEISKEVNWISNKNKDLYKNEEKKIRTKKLEIEKKKNIPETKAETLDKNLNKNKEIPSETIKIDKEKVTAGLAERHFDKKENIENITKNEEVIIGLDEINKTEKKENVIITEKRIESKKKDGIKTNETISETKKEISQENIENDIEILEKKSQEFLVERNVTNKPLNISEKSNKYTGTASNSIIPAEKHDTIYDVKTDIIKEPKRVNVDIIDIKKEIEDIQRIIKESQEKKTDIITPSTGEKNTEDNTAEKPDKEKKELKVEMIFEKNENVPHLKVPKKFHFNQMGREQIISFINDLFLKASKSSGNICFVGSENFKNMEKLFDELPDYFLNKKTISPVVLKAKCEPKKEKEQFRIFDKLMDKFIEYFNTLKIFKQKTLIDKLMMHDKTSILAVSKINFNIIKLFNKKVFEGTKNIDIDSTDFFEKCADFFCQLGEIQCPLILMANDFQHVDHSSLNIIKEMAKIIGDFPVLVLCLYDLSDAEDNVFSELFSEV